MKRTSKLLTVVVGTALAVLSLSGCAANTTTTDSFGNIIDPNMHHGLIDPNFELDPSYEQGSEHSMSITDKQSFAEAMIPHHQQAIDISEFAPLNTANPEILAIAYKIVLGQGPEIEKMTPWLNGKSVDYTMMMDGMLSTTQVNTLRGSKETQFDTLYAQYMIQHHEGAVKMAADAIGLDDPELTDFANEIIVTQSAEIEELMALLNN